MSSKVVILSLFTITLWSSAFVGVQAAMRTIEPGYLIFYHLYISALALFNIAKFKNAKAIALKDHPKVAISGILGSIMYCAFLAWA
jgi:hypothetical protein